MPMQNSLLLAQLKALGVCPCKIYYLWHNGRHWVCAHATFIAFGRTEGIGCVPMQKLLLLAELKALGVCPCKIYYSWQNQRHWMSTQFQPPPTPPPPPKSAADFGRLRRFVLPFCWVSGFRPFVLRICGVSVNSLIRFADTGSVEACVHSSSSGKLCLCSETIFLLRTSDKSAKNNRSWH